MDVSGKVCQFLIAHKRGIMKSLMSFAPKHNQKTSDYRENTCTNHMFTLKHKRNLPINVVIWRHHIYYKAKGKRLVHVKMCSPFNIVHQISHHK